MLNKILSILKGWKREKADYKLYKKRIKALPEDYQIVIKEIEAFMWEFSTGSSMMHVFIDMLEMFESAAQEGKNVLDVVGYDVSDFCDGLLKEVQAQTWTGKRKDKLNKSIHKQLKK